MPFKFQTQSYQLQTSTRFQSAKKEIAQTIAEACTAIQGVRPPSSEGGVQEAYLKTVQDFNRDRGRDLYYPFISSGLGAGPWIELLDGSVKYDMITGIGINFFGHSHPALIEEMIEALPTDVMQGNLEPGIEGKELLTALLSRVGKDCRLNHGWLMCSGTMVNEVALKIIRQKRAPATKILAFNDCFAGRSTAMQEITDNPAYRQGQPVYGEVEYLPFYQPKKGLAESTEDTLKIMRQHLARYPGKFAALMIELVQGEGGFNFAPKDFYLSLFEEAKKSGLTIWVDEIQSFGRTGELFCYQKFSLEKYVDVVTVGKMLQACAVLYTDEYNPKPGLVSGTFSGSTVALRCARKVLELLDKGEFLGKNGKIEKLSARFVQNLNQLAEGTCKGLIQEVRAIGGMIAFEPLAGTMEDVKAVLMRLFDLGVIAFYCGHGPYYIRFLPPLGVMTDQQIDEVCHFVEKALMEVAKKKSSQSV